MMPIFQVLNEDDLRFVIDEALKLLEEIGVEIEEPRHLEFLTEAGFKTEENSKRVFFSSDNVSKAFQTAPKEIALYDVSGEQVVVLEKDSVSFVPGSAALQILDGGTGKIRDGRRDDLDQIGRVTEAIPTYKLQSTALVPSDVAQGVADRVRLYHALRSCSKPIVTGIFQEDSFIPMVRMLETVRGGAEVLKEKPLAIFDCCVTSPLKWSRLTLQALLECSSLGIPAEIISAPLLGATAPVTLQGALIQLVAENLSGVVMHQAKNPGSPVIWGGCPMAFDMKIGVTISAAPENSLLNTASSEIARHFGIPCHGYLALSDSKSLDAQAGFETALGALSAALSGMNVVSGAGLLNFICCQSLEKLVVDAEICEAALRIRKGISNQAIDHTSLLREAIAADGFLKLQHTRESYRTEFYWPGSIVDRSMEESCVATSLRAATAVEEMLASQKSEIISKEIKRELEKILVFEFEKWM